MIRSRITGKPRLSPGAVSEPASSGSCVAELCRCWSGARAGAICVNPGSNAVLRLICLRGEGVDIGRLSASARASTDSARSIPRLLRLDDKAASDWVTPNVPMFTIARRAGRRGKPAGEGHPALPLLGRWGGARWSAYQLPSVAGSIPLSRASVWVGAGSGAPRGTEPEDADADRSQDPECWPMVIGSAPSVPPEREPRAFVRQSESRGAVI